MAVVGEWTRGPAIGRGSSATVSLAVDLRTGEFFAVKSVGADRAGELRREQSILFGLSSPYVVRCLGSGVSAAEDGAASHDMLLEYAPGGTLADEVKRSGGRCEDGLIRSRARDILRGLAHVHAAGVAHCDVKGRNVLIGSDGRAMIADFGCARRVAAAAPGHIAGTPMFMAPEAARGEEQGTAADIWALGCTVIEMATGGAPWPQFADPVAALHHVGFSGEVPEFPLWLSDDGKDFLERCLRRDPRERWTAEQLLDHQFVAAVAAASSSNSMARISSKDIFVSPKSILDQALWDDSTADTDDDDTAAPTDRVRALAAGAPVVPDWTWDANWITVHSSSVSAASPEADGDGDSDLLVGSSAAPTGSPTAEGSSHAHGDSHGDLPSCNGDCYGGDMSSCIADCYGDVSSCNGGCSERFCGGNHVIRDCTLAITSNGFFPICRVTTTFVAKFFFLVRAGRLLSPRRCYSIPAVPFNFPRSITTHTELVDKHHWKMRIRAARTTGGGEGRGRIISFSSCATRDSQLGEAVVTPRARVVRMYVRARAHASWVAHGVMSRRRRRVRCVLRGAVHGRRHRSFAGREYERARRGFHRPSPWTIRETGTAPIERFFTHVRHARIDVPSSDAASLSSMRPPRGRVAFRSLRPVKSFPVSTHRPPDFSRRSRRRRHVCALGEVVR